MHTEKYPVKTVVITGAFSYTGKYVTRLLLNRAYKIRTVTFHPERENEFGGKVEVFPYNFEDPAQLERSLCGAFLPDQYLLGSISTRGRDLRRSS